MGVRICRVVLAHDAELGKKYGLQYAEGFHHIQPERSRGEECIERNARAAERLITLPVFKVGAHIQRARQQGT